jgi:hypothetical protein
MASRRSSTRIPGDAEVTRAGRRSRGGGGAASKKRRAAGGATVDAVFGSRSDVLRVLNYFKANCRSHKSQRFFLVEKYFRLRDLGAFKSDNPYHNEWLSFKAKWDK